MKFPELRLTRRKLIRHEYRDGVNVNILRPPVALVHTTGGETYTWHLGPGDAVRITGEFGTYSIEVESA